MKRGVDMNLKINAERCKSCEYCVISCKKGALKISTKINKEGYAHVEVDESKCILCGICYQVCPDNVFEIIKEEACQEA